MTRTPSTRQISNDAGRPADDTVVELSVIVPTYNRSEPLRACLEALSRQRIAGFEVVVVIDGSTDGTREMLAGMTTPYPLHAVWQQNSGQCAARNRGAAVANGRYCLFLDDDIIAGPGLVAGHLRAQREGGGVLALGQLTHVLPPHADWFARCFARAWSEHYERLNRGTRSPSWRDCYSGNMSVPRAAFLEAGGFAVDLPASFDAEIGYRLQRQGLSLVYLPDAIGKHDDPKDFHALVRDAERQGASCVEVYRRHPPTLPRLLGSFGDASLGVVLLRRVLLALGIPAGALAPIGPLLGRRSWTYAWSRFLHSYCYWRGVRRAMPDRDTWRRLTGGTPILMYHAFGGPDERTGRYVVPARRFARQMAWLRRLGYRPLSLDDFLRCRREYRLPPARSVVITIDDGYADSRTLAYPILRRYNVPATIFPVSGMIGGTNEWDHAGELAGRPLLSWADIRQMLRGGVRFGAHTRTHPRLTMIPAERAREEVTGARADLERELGIPILVFAYPYGVNDSRTQALVEQAGFLGGCGVKSGLNRPTTPLYALHRTEIYGTDSLVHFVLKLRFGQTPTFARRGRGR